ncbi:glucose-6-phosphate dehydrogenase [Herbivorax sp. ANBcel31]|uniref:glucose-6-phosphate dehydrogenase n=1 Tax=Herbivorax sp. ANBcel31 TaxID=3069754 RepID=UPI0027AE0AA4|nr:glucose-6-phosphate dehydrogenase [Herbivorax sp. ANBcel31]MDQ2085195.1 glucose-6-phosphate dehydrogenase [Herbivorax sp. ANBcel31]
MKNRLESNEELAFIIFGGTGDLAKRKLIPALFSIMKEEKLSEKFSIVLVGRRDKDVSEYKKELLQFVKAYSRYKTKNDDWQIFSDKIKYCKFDFIDQDKGYDILAKFLDHYDNRIFYLAVAPEFFEIIIGRLKNHNLIELDKGFQRIMIEKPFGSSLESARKLNEAITKIIPEKKIFRVDHYLGKEMIQNILSMRFGNSIFEPLWNHHYIDNVQIISTETIGVESRGGYYDNTGIIKDMLQNHILQMLSLIAMEPPVDLEPESIRNEKVKVLNSLRMFDKKSAQKNIVKGQYDKGVVKGEKVLSYREEERVAKNSNTDTFIALKINVDNFRWAGVPFYIKTGKRLNRKVTEIIVQFKKLPGVNFYKNLSNAEPNLLVIRIQPEEGVFAQINAKSPGINLVEPVKMNYCQSCRIDYNSPEAYEQIIIEAIKNNSSIFTRWDELEYSWNFEKSIRESFKGIEPDYPNYKPSSKGPAESIELLKRDGRMWWDTRELT